MNHKFNDLFHNIQTTKYSCDKKNHDKNLWSILLLYKTTSVIIYGLFIHLKSTSIMFSKVVCDKMVVCETTYKYSMHELIERKKRNTDSSETADEVASASNNNDNSLGDSCFGGLSEEKIKELQEELDKAKEEYENSYSSKSRCEIQ